MCVKYGTAEAIFLLISQGHFAKVWQQQDTFITMN